MNSRALGMHVNTIPWILFDCELVTYVLLEEENSIQGLV